MSVELVPHLFHTTSNRPTARLRVLRVSAGRRRRLEPRRVPDSRQQLELGGAPLMPGLVEWRATPSSPLESHGGRPALVELRGPCIFGGGGGTADPCGGVHPAAVATGGLRPPWIVPNRWKGGAGCNAYPVICSQSALGTSAIRHVRAFRGGRRGRARARHVDRGGTAGRELAASTRGSASLQPVRPPLVCCIVGWGGRTGCNASGSIGRSRRLAPRRGRSVGVVATAPVPPTGDFASTSSTVSGRG